MSEIEHSAAGLSPSVSKDDKPPLDEIQNPFLPEGASPPATFEEYLALAKLTDWPYKEPDESLVKGFKTETLEELLHLLESAALVSDINPLQDLSKKLQEFEEHLCQHARKFMIACDPAGKVGKEPLEPCSQGSRHGETLEGKSSEEVGESEGEKLYDAMKENSIDFCTFPGFSIKHLTNLPSNREAAPILETVTIAQSFKSGFMKLWKKIFQSEASVAILLDAFWWTFLDLFQPKENKDRSQLFNRISDSFVALINSIHLDLKDKFLVVYADCLAQAIYVTYFRSFPESSHRFGGSFKDYLINIIHEWVTGGLPPARRWKKWNTDLLLKGNESFKMSGVDINALSSIAHGHCDGIKMDEKFHRLKDELDQVIVDLFDEEKKKIKTTPETPRLRFSLPFGLEGNLNKCKEQKRPSRLVPEETKKERILFNMKAQSPLVSHYMKMIGLKASEAADARKELVSRTHDKRLSGNGL